MYNDSLICIQMIVILLAIGPNNFFYKKHLYILIAFLIFCIIFLIIFSNQIYTLSLCVLYYLLVFILSYIRLKSIFLVFLLFLIQNFLLTFIWIIGYDFPTLVLGSLSPYSQFFSFISQFFLLFLSLLVLNFLNKRYKLWIKISKYSKPWTRLTIICSISNSFLMIYKQYIIIETKSFNNYFFLTITLLGASFSFFLIIFLVIKTYENKALIDQMIIKSQENSAFIMLANEFNHDYKTFLYTIKRYLELEDFNELNNYINSLENYSTRLLNYSLLEQVYNIKEPAIQGLLINCIEQCYSKKIKLSLDIHEISNDTFFSTIDFSRCLSILLNNAIEHSTNKIYINFSYLDGFPSCSISNTSQPSIEIDKIFQRNFSTKKNHRGIGLSILKNIIQDYPHIYLTVKNTDNWISFTITSSKKSDYTVNK